MHRMFVLSFLFAFALAARAQSEKTDSTAGDTTLRGAKLREVVVTKDRRLPIFVSPETKDLGPRVKSLGDIIGPRATDMIMHPFAFKSRKEERRRRKVMKKLWEYDHIKTDDELLREALLREGLDPDSLLRR